MEAHATVVERENIALRTASPTGFHWPAVIASVVIGFGFTILLVTIGAAADAMAIDGAGTGDDGKIAAALGAWTVIAAIGGTFLGCYIGGRYTRWTSRGNAVYHALAAWGLSVMIGVWLGASGTTGLLGSSLTAAANMPRRAQQAASGVSAKDAADAADAIGWGGWALAAGMVLTLIAAVGAWMLGSRRHLDGFERA